MVRVPEPFDFEEIKKRGSSDKHIVLRVADTASEKGLDSNKEGDILDTWVEDVVPDGKDIFRPYDGHYPSTSNSRLKDYVLVYEEVRLKEYRIDSIVRYPEDGWNLVEVKTGKSLGLGVIGHLLSKRALFEDIFTVNPDNVDMTVLSDEESDSFGRTISKVNSQYGVDIEFEVVDI